MKNRILISESMRKWFRIEFRICIPSDSGSNYAFCSRFFSISAYKPRLIISVMLLFLYFWLITLKYSHSFVSKCTSIIFTCTLPVHSQRALNFSQPRLPPTLYNNFVLKIVPTDCSLKTFTYFVYIYLLSMEETEWMRGNAAPSLLIGDLKTVSYVCTGIFLFFICAFFIHTKKGPPPPPARI